MTGAHDTVPMPDEPTRLAGRFRLRRLLARGGMGAVYEAYDENLGRAVAIKLLPSGGGHIAVERFRREARAIAGLNHPGIVALYDHGVDGGRHYLAMELVAGRDLSSVLHEEGPLPARQALATAAQVAEALQHAHAAGVVHRDIKPANILIDGDGRIRLTDFGIARMSGAAALTATGTMMGTARYCAPEQVAGEPVGPAADVYATGAVLYELLTGSPPFDGDHPSAVATRRLTEAFPTPSHARPELPTAIDDVIARATARDPGDRFPSAGAFARALNRAALRVAEPTTPLDVPTRPLPTLPAQPSTVSKTATRWWRSRALQQRRVIAAAAVLLGLAIVLLAVLTTNGRSATEDTATSPNAPAGRQDDRPAPTEPSRTPPTQPPPATDRRAEPPAETSFEIAPAILGLDGDQVAARLEEEGFAVEVRPGPSEQPAGTITDVDPPVGSHVQRGDTIVLHLAQR